MDLGIQSHESAYIIPYKHSITQADFLEFPKENGKQADSSTKTKNISSKIQRSAFDLYDIGLNTFPLPYAKKGGFAWKTLQYTRLDRDHEDYGLFMLFSGQCNMGIMCGRTSRNLFIIDCESEIILQHHINALSTRSIPLWIAKTARGGHIYLFSSDGEVDNVPSGILHDAEIRGHNNYVLAPPSMHPSGVPYSWMCQQGDEPPTVSIRQINWLTDTYGNAIKLSAHKTQSMKNVKTNKRAYSPLSRRTRNYIQSGHSTPEGTRNNELFCASCDMAGNQFDKDQTYATLYPVAQASGLPREEIRATINSAYKQQRTPSKTQNNQHNRTPDWQWATLFGDHHNWGGRAKTSKRAIFGALINRAKVSSNEDGLFRASIREIASLARVGTATVQRILNEFQNSDNPYIHKCGYDKTSKATLWKFPKQIIQNGQELNTDTLKKAPQWLSCSVSLLHQPDAVEREALGYNGLLLYRVMVDYAQPIYPKKLSELSGLADHQVKYALKKLVHFDLIQRVDDGWVACAYDDDALDMKIHEKRDIIGKGKKRMQQFARERAIYAGRQMFYARLRYERNAFKQAVRHVLQTRRYAKYGREHFTPLPIFREVTYTNNDQQFVRYQRLALSDLDDDDRSLVEFGLSLGAEVVLSGSSTGE
jgi:predicted transcriptional regulator